MKCANPLYEIFLNQKCKNNAYCPCWEGANKPDSGSTDGSKQWRDWDLFELKERRDAYPNQEGMISVADADDIKNAVATAVGVKVGLAAGGMASAALIGVSVPGIGPLIAGAMLVGMFADDIHVYSNWVF